MEEITKFSTKRFEAISPIVERMHDRQKLVVRNIEERGGSECMYFESVGIGGLCIACDEV